MDIESADIEAIAINLKEGKIGVLPTDTLYGLHCLSKREDLRKKVNRIKERDENLPLITLLTDVSQLVFFGIELDKFSTEVVKEKWPGPNTLIIKDQAFRIPAYDYIQKILKLTGPLISTSANKTGDPSAFTIKEAKKYLGNSVDFYVNVGKLESEPSKMYKIENGKIERIR